MAENVTYTRTDHAAIREALGKIPSEARAGGATAVAMLTRCGMVALARIKRAFITKSRGGTDEAGDSWKPLSPKTIAYSRRGRTKGERSRESMPSQALNSKQQTRWWELYRQGLAMYRGDKGHAARRAWLILKGEGATTLLDKYGHRQVDILRDTGLLLNSLSPGVVSAEQVFRVGNGDVTIGTNRAGAAAHHKGIPGRLPQRRLWPPVSSWPATWWRDITDEVRAGMVDIVAQIIKETHS